MARVLADLCVPFTACDGPVLGVGGRRRHRQLRRAGAVHSGDCLRGDLPPSTRRPVPHTVFTRPQSSRNTCPPPVNPPARVLQVPAAFFVKVSYVKTLQDPARYQQFAYRPTAAGGGVSAQGGRGGGRQHPGISWPRTLVAIIPIAAEPPGSPFDRHRAVPGQCGDGLRPNQA